MPTIPSLVSVTILDNSIQVDATNLIAVSIANSLEPIPDYSEMEYNKSSIRNVKITRSRKIVEVVMYDNSVILICAHPDLQPNVVPITSVDGVEITTTDQLFSLIRPIVRYA